jgi:N-acetylglutamate synthase-like GNAT family acetyltransferase
MKLIDVNKNNVVQTGFFCKMSQKKNDGYKRKLKWLDTRFDEGLKIKMLDIKTGQRGFIEYIPGKYAWRPVHADDYMFVHCLWVVGQSKGKGYAQMLVDECIKDAKKDGLSGVAMVVSEGNWLAGKDILLKAGFKSVDKAPPAFDLMVLKFKKCSDPLFPTDWDKRIEKFGDGLTVVRTDQCPYLDDASKTVRDYAAKEKIKFKEVELESSEQIKNESPTPYGVFSIIYNRKLLSYHYLLPNDIDPAIKALEN